MTRRKCVLLALLLSVSGVVCFRVNSGAEELTCHEQGSPSPMAPAEPTSSTGITPARSTAFTTLISPTQSTATTPVITPAQPTAVTTLKTPTQLTAITPAQSMTLTPPISPTPATARSGSKQVAVISGCLKIASHAGRGGDPGNHRSRTTKIDETSAGAAPTIAVNSPLSAGASVNVVPGPFEQDRKNLLFAIQQAQKQGIGISSYTGAFEEIEHAITTGEDESTLRTRIESIGGSLRDQFTKRQAIQMRPSPSSYLKVERGRDMTEGLEAKALSYSGVYVNQEKPNLFNFFRFFPDGTVRSITFVQRPEESSDHLIEYVKTRIHTFTQEANSCKFDMGDTTIKFACGGLVYTATVIPGGLSVYWTSTISKRCGRCGFYFVSD